MDLPQRVKFATLTSEGIHNLWEVLRQFPTTFADGTKDPENFANRLLASDSMVFIIDNGGIVLIEGIIPGFKAEFHATFWDRKLSSRKDVLKDLVIWLFIVLQLERLETTVVSYAKAVRRFLTDRLGFTHEGTLRRAFRNNGLLHDLHIYSILREEVFHGTERP